MPRSANATPTGLQGKGPNGGDLTRATHDWAVSFSNFDRAWNPPQLPTGGKAKGEGIVVVHPDTGYTEHPELMDGGRYLLDPALAKNFHRRNGLRPSVARYLPANDDLTGMFSSHGTGTASVMMSGIGAPSAQAFPGYSQAGVVTGVAPMAEVIPCRITNWVILNDFTDAALARALYHAISLNQTMVGVVSISLGRSTTGWVGNTVRQALVEARNRGIVICAAAGQVLDQVPEWATRNVNVAFPASDPNTIGTAACGSDHVMLGPGFYDGPGVDITAPGVNVWYARSRPGASGSGTDYVVLGEGVGTSYSTAITAGACAVWQAYHGRANLLQKYGSQKTDANGNTYYEAPLILTVFREMLRRSCHVPSGWNTTRHGPGVLDAEALLAEPLPTLAQAQNL